MNHILAYSDIDFLKTLVQKYPESIWMVETGGTTSAEKIAETKKKTLAESVFDKPIENSMEFDRAATGVLCLKYVLTNDYKSFTACQNEAVRLSEEDFAQLKKITEELLTGAEGEDLSDLAMYAILCNDLGKTRRAASAYEDLGEAPADHDTVLAKLLQKKFNMFTGLHTFSPRQQHLFLEGMENGFNFGQFIQGENLPADFINWQKYQKQRKKYILFMPFTILPVRRGMFIRTVHWS